ncbi:MAG TPA: hypothetical protein VN428_03140 [Bryobacteraceae bacterium]|nr:hypothetical protein [Bryobacteraceae bacterium]
MALLTIARYWYVQGRPEPKGARPLGSFEAWCTVVGGMLESAGVAGFLANADTMFDRADSEAAQWEAFLLALAEMFGSESFRVNDIVNGLSLKDGTEAARAERLAAALPDSLADGPDHAGGFFRRRVGKSFAARAGRRFGDSQVFIGRADEDKKTKVQRWKVVRR